LGSQYDKEILSKHSILHHKIRIHKVFAKGTNKRLRKFIKRIVGRLPLYLESLSLIEAQKVIIGLKKWKKNKELKS